MAEDITRYIKKEVERELWARSSGRCQFNGCNKLLYKSPVTQEQVNIAEKAHIYSFSKDGPRGWGPLILNKDKLNDIDNLMLMCHDCHKLIDSDKEGLKYSAELLKLWKKEHEKKVYIVTGVENDKKSHVVFYGSNIGDQKSPLQKYEAMEAMFPFRYPANEEPINLSMSGSHKDSESIFWAIEEKHLNTMFLQQIEPKIVENNPSHFSLFAFAPMPLLIKLGALFTDKISVDVFQPIREPKTWKWQTAPSSNFRFIVHKGQSIDALPILIISLSGKISHNRITSIVGDDVDIWEITVEDEFLHNDFMKSTSQLSMFRSEMRKLISEIHQQHYDKTLHIFPAMPVSCAIELGRIRMPKPDMPWIIFDHDKETNKFIKTITIGETLNDN